MVNLYDAIFIITVYTTIKEAGTTTGPETYNGIEPNDDGCAIQDMVLRCGIGEGVLSDGVVGPTNSVDLNDREQVQQFFIWHRDNGSVTLSFEIGPSVDFTVSYVDIYTLNIPEEKIGSPATTGFRDDPTGDDMIIDPCSLSSSGNTLSRNIYNLSQTADLLIITFTFSESIDWLFISEIKLCSGDLPNMCDTPTTTPSPTTDPPTDPPTPPSIILSYPPLTGVIVTPDLNNPESVTLTCSVTSPSTNDYQYQWQWLKNGIALNTPSLNTESFSLILFGLQYTDAGDYMCTVEYVMCSDRIDCSQTTPVTGTITLNLPGI